MIERLLRLLSYHGPGGFSLARAQRLSGGTGNLIGAIVHSNAPEIERDRLVALERVAWKKGYQLLISSVSPGQARAADVPDQLDT